MALDRTPEQLLMELEIERQRIKQLQRLLQAIVALHERTLSVLTTAWGIWILLPFWDTLGSSQTLAALDRLGTSVVLFVLSLFGERIPISVLFDATVHGADVFWGVIITALGATQLWCSYRSSIYHRQVVAIFAGGFWFYIAASFMTTNFASTATIVCTWLAANYWINVWVLARLNDGLV